MSENNHPSISIWAKMMWGIVLILLILGVFWMYVQPEFMVRMADMVWSCL